MSHSFSLLLVVPDGRVRRGLVRHLGAHVGVLSLGSAVEGLAVSPREVDAVVVSADLPDGSGLAVIEHFLARAPTLPALLLVGPEDVDTIARARRLGVEVGHRRPRGPRLAAFLRGLAAFQRAIVPRVAESCNLTLREEEVLRLLLRGLSYGETAEAMGVRLDSVRSYRKRVLRKMRVARLSDVLFPSGAVAEVGQAAPSQP